MLTSIYQQIKTILLQIADIRAGKTKFHLNVIVKKKIYCIILEATGTVFIYHAILINEIDVCIACGGNCN